VVIIADTPYPVSIPCPVPGLQFSYHAAGCKTPYPVKGILVFFLQILWTIGKSGFTPKRKIIIIIIGYRNEVRLGDVLGKSAVKGIAYSGCLSCLEPVRYIINLLF